MTFCARTRSYDNVLIYKTSYDNFTTKMLRPLFRCLMTIEISDSNSVQHEKTSSYQFNL